MAALGNDVDELKITNAYLVQPERNISRIISKTEMVRRTGSKSSLRSIVLPYI